MAHLLDLIPLLCDHCAHPPAPRPPCGLSSGLDSNTLQGNSPQSNSTSFLQRCDHVFPNETQSCKTQSQHLCPRETELRHYGMPSIPCSPQLAMSPHPGPPGRTETTFVNSSTQHDPTSMNVSLSHTHTHPHSLGSSRGLLLLPQPSWRL